MKIVIIKYPGGNLRSISCSLERIGFESVVSDDKEVIKSSDKVIIPGVGEAKSAMKHLKKKELDKLIPNLKQPVLGICLGMQLLCLHSEENNTNCLGVFNINVKKFLPSKEFLFKIPCIGWNKIFNTKNILFQNLEQNVYQYFVHSYYIPINLFTVASVNYFITYSAAIQKNNFYAVQFHPEKSGKEGEKIINQFLKL